MKKLSDILAYGGEDELRKQWRETEAASEFEPLPTGEYIARIICGELTNSNNGNPGYKLTFQVLEGEYTDRRFWHDIWLTDAAMPMAKRDLGKLGVTEPDHLNQPLPPGIRCRVKLTLRRDDSGTGFNRVKQFTVEGVDAPDSDVFGPVDAKGEGDGNG